MLIEDWEKPNIKNKIQYSQTMFLAKYGSLDLDDEDLKKRFIFDNEQIRFNKNTAAI